MHPVNDIIHQSIKIYTADGFCDFEAFTTAADFDRHPTDANWGENRFVKFNGNKLASTSRWEDFKTRTDWRRPSTARLESQRVFFEDAEIPDRYWLEPQRALFEHAEIPDLVYRKQKTKCLGGCQPWNSQTLHSRLVSRRRVSVSNKSDSFFFHYTRFDIIDLFSLRCRRYVLVQCYPCRPDSLHSVWTGTFHASPPSLRMANLKCGLDRSCHRFATFSADAAAES
jgi:hypothetical protein